MLLKLRMWCIKKMLEAKYRQCHSIAMQVVGMGSGNECQKFLNEAKDSLYLAAEDIKREIESLKEK